MEATQAPYKLKVRIGQAEFDAEGPEKNVKDQFQLFLAALEASGAAKAAPSSNGHIAKDATSAQTDDPVEFAWSRAYLRKGDKLSLHVLPQTKSVTADTIVLLIYGYQKLVGMEAVVSTLLMEAAKQSGLRLDRIDRNIPVEHAKLIIRGGQGKGTRYSLNNRGAAYAQELLEKLFE